MFIPPLTEEKKNEFSPFDMPRDLLMRKASSLLLVFVPHRLSSEAVRVASEGSPSKDAFRKFP